MKKSVLILSLSSILLLGSCGENKIPATFLVSFSSGEGYTINGEKLCEDYVNDEYRRVLSDE